MNKLPVIRVVLICAYKAVNHIYTTKNTPQGMMRSVSLRKAVYDEFDGKGVAGFILATPIVYYILVAEKGQRVEEFVNSRVF